MNREREYNRSTVVKLGILTLLGYFVGAVVPPQTDYSDLASAYNVGFASAKNDYEHKHQLIGDLFLKYDKSILPVKNSSNVLTVTIDLSLSQLIELDERNQNLKTSVWMRWFWTDENLAWNASNYGDIRELLVSPGKPWVPDITVYNSIKPEDVGWPQHYYVEVQSNGQVAWKFPIFMDTSCKMDMSLFPFDTQRCKLQMGSWAYTGSSMDLQVVDKDGDRSTYVNNGEWELQDVKAERVISVYPCCPGISYPDIVYTFVLKRMSLYYIFNLLLPCVLITSMSLLGLVLPVESGEKISLNVTILLTMVVLLLIVADIMPAQSEVIPAIGKYFIVCILLLSASTVASVSVLHFHFRGSRGRPVPVWVRKFVIYKLGKVLFYGKTIQGMETETAEEVNKDEEIPREITRTPVIPLCEDPAARETALHDDELDKDNVSKAWGDMLASNKRKTNQHSLTQSQSTAFSTDETESSTESVSSDRSVEPKPDPFFKPRMTAEQEWMALALVMDRLYFVIFTISTISITIYAFAHIN